MSGDVDEETCERFMAGGCHALALALAERTGMHLAVLWIARGRREEVAHVVAVEPEADLSDDRLTVFDVQGLRGLPEVLDELEFDPVEETFRVERASEAEIVGMTASSRPAHRKLRELTEDLKEEAADVAERLVSGRRASP